MYYTQDRVTVAEGRMADPKRADEMVATAQAARIAGWHLGQTISFGAFTLHRRTRRASASQTTRPAVRFSAKLVGLVVLSSQVVHDDVDTFPTDVLMSPALTRRLSHSGAYPTYALRLDHGSRDVAAVERAHHRVAASGHSLHLSRHVRRRGTGREGQQARGDRARAPSVSSPASPRC